MQHRHDAFDIIDFMATAHLVVSDGRTDGPEPRRITAVAPARQIDREPGGQKGKHDGRAKGRRRPADLGKDQPQRKAGAQPEDCRQICQCRPAHATRPANESPIIMMADPSADRVNQWYRDADP